MAPDSSTLRFRRPPSQVVRTHAPILYAVARSPTATSPADWPCRRKKSITTRACSSVESKIVEWPGTLDHVLLGTCDPLVDGLLPGPVRTLVPGRHDVLVSAEDEGRRRDPPEPRPEVHVAHRLARGGEDLDPVRVTEDRLNVIDERSRILLLEEGLREGLPGDQLGKDAAARAVRIHLSDVDPVLEDQAPSRRRASQLSS